jgi:hypothetical protein
MKHFVETVRNAVEQENWYAALAVALTLPDICGKLETPQEPSSQRYIGWYRFNLEPGYTRKLGDAKDHVFLSGEDCYVLRCAFLHAGDMDIRAENVSQALARFQFVVPPDHESWHMNQYGLVLQLQVDLFCEEMCQAVEAWLLRVFGDAAIQARINSLPTIKGM